MAPLRRAQCTAKIIRPFRCNDMLALFEGKSPRISVEFVYYR